MLCILCASGVIYLCNNKNSKTSSIKVNNDNKVISLKVTNKGLLVKPKKNLIVCIDPGHGAYDNGTISANGILEKDVDLKVGLKIGQILEENNLKVVYTRKNDKTILGKRENEDLKKRVKISHDSNANIYVAIHCNDFKDTSVNGVEVCCNEPKTKSEALAIKIQKRLHDLNYTKDRKIKYRDTAPIYVLKKNKATAALVEIGYLSNKDDCKFISSEEGQAKCAEAIAKAILDFIENMNK